MPTTLLSLILAASFAIPPDGKIDAVYLNANIYTASRHSRAEALAVDGDTIAAIGSRAEVLVKAPNAPTIDLHGATVLPGLIDAHGHMASLGALSTIQLDLRGVTSEEELVSRAVERAKSLSPGAWVVGRNWDHESWANRQLPTRVLLSKALPENPVFLRRVDGHAAVANDLALKRAGLTRETPAPTGGAILHDANGDPTGVFIDNAMDLINAVVQVINPAPEELLLEAQRKCLEAGLTGVHDMGVGLKGIEAYQSLNTSGRLKMRINVMIDAETGPKYFAQHDPSSTPHLSIRGVKAYMDGALGSRGAWLLEPYTDHPTDESGKAYTGLAVSRPEEIRALADDALRRGYQVVVHAIGDRGNREVLDAFEHALAAHPTPDHRLRIEHAQVLSPQDIHRFAALGVIASMQPTHCTSDMRWAAARLGEARSEGAYAWASLLKSGAHLAGGSDFPVESHNPFLGLYAAATRQDMDGKPEGGWHANQRLTREESLAMFTTAAAFAGFREKEVGSLEVGKLADFIVIDRDVMTCPERSIADAQVLQTFIGGEEVFHRASP